MHQKWPEIWQWKDLNFVSTFYLRASRVLLFPLRPTLLPSGVFGLESTPTDPIWASLTDVRLPVVNLVADMISCSCLCRFSLISRVSEMSGKKTKSRVNEANVFTFRQRILNYLPQIRLLLLLQQVLQSKSETTHIFTYLRKTSDHSTDH